MKLPDLEPQINVKGGSPSTPLPTSISDYNQQVGNPVHGWFHLQFRDLLWLATLIVGIIMFFYSRGSTDTRLSEKVDNLASAVNQTNTNVEKLATQVKSIDEKGTSGSQAAIHLEDEKNLEQDRRITNNEQQLSQLVPDVREIKTKLQIVADMLDEQRRSRK